MSHWHTLRLTLFCMVLLAPAAASADAIPVDVTECDMHTVGSSCNDRTRLGVCTMSTCNYIDYTIDAGGLPGTRTADCVRCVVDTSDAGNAGADGGPMPARPTANCSVSPAGTAVTSLGLVGLVLMLLARRRRA